MIFLLIELFFLISAARMIDLSLNYLIFIFNVRTNHEMRFRLLTNKLTTNSRCLEFFFRLTIEINDSHHFYFIIRL